MEYERGRSLDALIPRQGLRLTELLRIAISCSTRRDGIACLAPLAIRGAISSTAYTNVSPDGTTILVQQQTLTNDLMLIENFR
jgi:hypothetical protein